jgi:hypothetical protein
METTLQSRKKLRLAMVWFWTVELFALMLVGLCWGSFAVPQALPWNPMWVFSFLMDFSSGVMACLFLTVCALWRKHRWLAAGGITLCVLWVVWAELPRLAYYESNL